MLHFTLQDMDEKLRPSIKRGNSSKDVSMICFEYVEKEPSKESSKSVSKLSTDSLENNEERKSSFHSKRSKEKPSEIEQSIEHMIQEPETPLIAPSKLDMPIQNKPIDRDLSLVTIERKLSSQL
jgi:hypothetical protein